MDFDTDGYLRVDAPDSLGASPSGIAFATSTGDLLEVSCCGAGVFRLRVGSTTSPDYGIVRAQTKSCTITQPQFGMWTLSAGDTAFELTGKPHKHLLRAHCQRRPTKVLLDGKPLAEAKPSTDGKPSAEPGTWRWDQAGRRLWIRGQQPGKYEVTLE